MNPLVWRRVVYAVECDDEGTCPVCGDRDFADCPCPGPSQESEFEYRAFKGMLFARPIGARTRAVEAKP